MSSTNKTALGLNMWEASDKPVRQDFVNDNSIIDEKITQLNSNLDNVNSDLALNVKVFGGLTTPSATEGLIYGSFPNDYAIIGMDIYAYSQYRGNVCKWAQTGEQVLLFDVPTDYQGRPCRFYAKRIN